MAKISNIIQQNLSNLVGSVSGQVGAAQGFAANLFNKAKNATQTNAAAAKILNKSPLELNDTSATSHMKQNPYEYGQVYYPENVMNLGTGHYIIIDVLETSTIGSDIGQYLRKGASAGLKKLGADGIATNLQKGVKTGRNTKLANGEDRISGTSSGINAGVLGSRHSRVSDTIVLYTPPGIKTTYMVNHEGTETGMLGDIAGVKSFTDLGARAAEIMSKIGAEAGQMITSLIPGAGDLKGALSKVTGRAFNNNVEMVFKGVPMREFTYNFEFVPKNRGELDSSRKIMQLLRFHMHPELGARNDFIVPSQFQLTFMYLDKRNMYIPRISKCVLKNMDLSHGDDSKFTTFPGDELGAAPVYTKMSLMFAETEIMTKKTMAEGY